MKRMVTEKEVAEIASAVAIDEIEDATIESSQLSSGEATEGQVLTADGDGGCAWADASGGGKFAHLIFFSASSPSLQGVMLIVNDDQTAFTSVSSSVGGVSAWLYANGYTSSSNFYYPVWWYRNEITSSNQLTMYEANGAYSESSTKLSIYSPSTIHTFSISGTSISITTSSSTTYIKQTSLNFLRDIVIPL